ncbi:dihydroorotase family protein [Ornithinimicrobium faecis]|uniref:Dihydroorotase family protein n=1 Tax=Ornithinimicrobium faecis TaxID=2934158 RepID=A0ABY4YV39_9MICO|nr:dihydroorotase family protein [Ornithinimicrobium sp. HY1793]USQ80120.1 dihydroorotase family protein [Ornithinimicrobium sp. HY1793]
MFDGDIAVKDETIAAVAPSIDANRAAALVDGQGKLAFPGAVDAHQHWGIYNPYREDVVTESRAAAQGGVTTGINYTRTGQYYLNEGGPYEQFLPKVLAACEGRAHIDYAFHVAPMSRQHIEELPLIAEKFGVTSFKIFMFYGGFGLHGASSSQRDFLMLGEDEHYDFAHFEFVMRGIQRLREEQPELADQISLSLHCETAEIMRAYTQLVQTEGVLTGLEAYSAARPPHSEGLAIAIAAYLAHETALPNINLLHLSSAKAMEAALTMQQAFPHINFRREVTIGHLLADYHTAAGVGGKVNPPLRSADDVEALWEHLLAGDIDWVVSDHACCKDEMKFGHGEDRDDVFMAKSGFGGAEYLLPGLVGAGLKRGLSERRIAQLTSWNPAQRFGLPNKGDIAVGFDADIALVDPTQSTVIRPDDSESTQEYTPFDGFTLESVVTDTFVRGHHVFADGRIVGDPNGRYVARGNSDASS